MNDVRFNMYNVCYKRILVLWIFTAFIVLLGLLFSGVTGLTLFGLGVMWLVLNAAAIFFCMFIKIKLNHNLEKCMGQVNKHLLRHKILLGLDDRGKISCHKVNLCFIYFDTTDCIVSVIKYIKFILSRLNIIVICIVRCYMYYFQLKLTIFLKNCLYFVTYHLYNIFKNLFYFTIEKITRSYRT